MTHDEAEQFQKDMLEAAKPLMKFMADNIHPHTVAHVTSTDVQIFEGLSVATTHEFLRG